MDGELAQSLPHGRGRGQIGVAKAEILNLVSAMLLLELGPGLEHAAYP